MQIGNIEIKFDRISALIFVFTLIILFLTIPFSYGAVTKISIPTKTVSGLHPIVRKIPLEPELILALSGGAVRGFAHVGVLAAFEEADVPIAGIAGVSIGALIGALYAGGLSPSEIKHVIQKINLETILLDQPARKSLLLARKREYSRHLIEIRLSKNLSPIMPGALSPGQKLYQLLLDLTLNLPLNTTGSWDKLPTRLRILATDLNTGEPVEFFAGDFTPAIRSSMSVPLLFDPFEFNSRLYIDGGVSANIPVSTAISMSGERIVAINLTSDLKDHEQPFKPWHIVDQVTTIMQEQPNKAAMQKADLTITPDFELNVTVDENYDYYFETGRLAVMQHILEIKKLLSPAESEEDKKFRQFQSLKIEPQTQIKVINNLISQADLQSISDVKSLLKDIYKSGFVQDVQAEYDESSQSLLIRAEFNPVINKLRVTGNSHLPESVITRLFHSFEGGTLNYDEFQAALISLLKQYRQAGLAAAYINGIEYDSQSSTITVTVNEGRLGSIVFHGLKRVPKAFLSAEVPIKVGDPITIAGVIDGTFNLYATGLFRSVSPVITADSDRDGLIKLNYYLHEHPAPPVRLGLAYQTERRTHGFVETILPNPFTYAARLGMYMSVGEKDSHHQLSFSIDKFFGIPVMSNLALAYSAHKRKRYNSSHDELGEYEESRWGGNFKLGGTPTRWGLLAFTARWEEHRNIYFSAENQYNLTGIGIELGVDTQDRYPYPTEGLRFDANFETARTNLDGQPSFNRFWSSFEGHVSLSERYTLGFKTEGNFADRTAPPDERFKLGGIYDFTGLQLDEKIGIIQMAAELDLRFDLLSRMLSDAYIGVHGNIGGSWKDPEARYKREDLLISFGSYFVLDTILGPLHIEWGQLIPNGAHTRQNVIYLQAGNLF